MQGEPERVALRDGGPPIARVEHMISSLRGCICVAVLCATVTVPAAENWPQWRGPSLNGVRDRQQECKQNKSSPSPVTDGAHVWAMTGTGILKAFDFNGTEKWSRDIQKDYGRFGLNWGYGSSPLLYGDALYVQVLHGMRT